MGALDVDDGGLAGREAPLDGGVETSRGLRNREVSTEADVEALVNEVRAPLLEQVKAGGRVRLL